MYIDNDEIENVILVTDWFYWLRPVLIIIIHYINYIISLFKTGCIQQ